jgi:flagellar assembly factor FliW
MALFWLPFFQKRECGSNPVVSPYLLTKYEFKDIHESRNKENNGDSLKSYQAYSIVFMPSPHILEGFVVLHETIH